MKNGDRYYGSLPSEPSIEEYGKFEDMANKKLNASDTSGVTLVHNNCGFLGYYATYKDTVSNVYDSTYLENGKYVNQYSVSLWYDNHKKVKTTKHKLTSLDDVRAWIVDTYNSL